MLKCSSGWDCLQLTLHNQVLENLHLRTNCLLGSGRWQHRSKASFISLNSLMMSGVIGILALTSVVLSN